MSSNIDYLSIDDTYPVAGIDNSTQGFRRNFALIRNNFQAAKVEIEDLQTNSPVTNGPSDFNNNSIINANFVSCTTEVHTTSASTDENIDFSNGSYHVVAVSNDVTLTFINWPAAGKYGEIVVELYGDGTARAVTFASEDGGNIMIPTDALWTNPYTITSATLPQIIKFWTHDGGVNILSMNIASYS